MIDICFEVHAQTYHNAAGLASGHYDVALTDHGREHAQSVLRTRYTGQHFDIVFTSDTQRAYDTACLIFAGRRSPFCRTHGCVNVTTGTLKDVHVQRWKRHVYAAIYTPFPHGESYVQVAVRMRRFLAQLATEREGQQVLLVGHAATLWMLEHWLRPRPLAAVVGIFPAQPWRFTLVGFPGTRED